MICPKCCAENGEGATYCLNCGANMLEEENKQKEETEEVKVEVTPEPTIEIGSMTEPEANEVVKAEKMSESIKPSKPKKTVKIDVFGYFKSIYQVVLHPTSKLDGELDKYNDITNSALMGVIVAAIATVLKLIITMISAARVKSVFGDTSWNWDNLGELNYFREIGLSFLIFVGMIAAFAGIVYLAGLVVKKETKFSKLIALGTMALVPYLVITYLLVPILSLIWWPLAKIVMTFGEVYTLLILYEGVNKQITLEGDKKIFFNLIIFGIMLSALFLVNYYVMTSSITSEISNTISSIFD